MTQNYQNYEMKVQGLLERISSLVTDYENKLADVRVQYTGLLNEIAALKEENQAVLNQMEEIRQQNEQLQSKVETDIRTGQNGFDEADKNAPAREVIPPH